MNAYCVYSEMSKSPKQLPNCLKITETNVALGVFNSDVCGYSATVYVTIHESCSRKALSGP